MSAKRADRHVLRLAIAGAVPLLSLTLAASAQMASGNDGRALDANNRVGSGGVNGPGPYSGGGGGVTPNQIVYGNVTSGKGFTGPVAERDPSAFFGPTSGGIADRFIANSSGAPLPYQPAIDMTKAQPFYGSSRFVAPPVGSVRVGFTGSYVGTNLPPDSPLMQNPLASPYGEQTQQLGQLTIIGTRTTVTGNEYGEQLFQSSLDNGTLQSTFSGSPLYGIQSLQNGPVDNTLGLGANGPIGPDNRFQFQSPEERRMQMELQQPGQQQPAGQQPTSGQQPNAQQPNAQQPKGQQSNQLGQQQTNTLQQPFESIDNSSLNDRAALAGSSQAFSSNLQTGVGTQQRVTLASPEAQSGQYNELKKRLERYQSPIEIATQQQVDAQRARRAAQNRIGASTRPAGAGIVPEVIKPGGQPGMIAPGIAPGAGAGAGAQPQVVAPKRGVAEQPAVQQPAANPQPTVTPAEPMKVSSLATGISARGLHELMLNGEELMKQGKFQSAVDKYNTAQRIAPNNPLVPVGLATAQLGAGAYLNASQTLHQVFQSAEPTLMAQYDIASWIPADRLSAIKTQLADLSTKDKQDETPEFLQAYIAYNTGDAAAAKEHLDEARKRSGGKDRLLDRLQTDWNLPQKPAPDLNK